MSLYIARNSAVAARSLDDEVVVMSVRDTTLFSLNPVAAEIWNAADGQTCLEDIVETRVCAKFDVDPATAYADAEVLCRDLACQGILMVSEQPIAGAGANK
jgi:hypothetical protein